MSLKVAKEQLGHIKPYFLKNEILKALTCAVKGLKALGAAQPPTDIRSILREGLGYLAKVEEIRQHVKPGSLVYQPGKEPEILQQLDKALQALDRQAGQEDHDTALARKIKLDQNFNQGKHLLEQRKPSEADAAFAEALKYYKDEHRIYPMIGKALLDAGEIRRALPYLKKAQELLPQDSSVRELFDTCARMREQLKNA